MKDEKKPLRKQLHRRGDADHPDNVKKSKPKPATEVKDNATTNNT